MPRPYRASPAASDRRSLMDITRRHGSLLGISRACPTPAMPSESRCTPLEPRCCCSCFRCRSYYSRSRCARLRTNDTANGNSFPSASQPARQAGRQTAASKRQLTETARFPAHALHISRRINIFNTYEYCRETERHVGSEIEKEKRDRGRREGRRGRQVEMMYSPAKPLCLSWAS